MKIKVLLGFLTGVALTAGVFYIASRRPQPPVAVVQEVAPPPLPTPAAPAPTETQVTPPQPEPPAAAPAPSAPAAPPPQIVKRAAPKPIRKPVESSFDKPSAAVPRPSPPPAEPVPAPGAAVVPTTPPPAEPVQQAPPPSAPEVETPRAPHSVTIPAGTLITVRLNQTVSTDQNQSGDVFSAILDQPVVADDFVIAERGARAEGRVVEAAKAGRVKGLSHLSVQLTRVNSADGQRIRLETLPFQKDGPKSEGEDAAKVGGGAAVGAIIGAIAGGGKGAAIGAGAGAAAGAGGVMVTRGKPAVLTAETRISFRLERPVTITERLMP